VLKQFVAELLELRPAIIMSQDLEVPDSVFVVDDDADIRDSLCELLSDVGYNVAPMESAAAVLQAAPAHTGAVCLLLDLQLPDMSGLNVQQALAHLQHLPVIIMSGSVQVPEAVCALKRGAIDVLEKPVQFEQILAAVEVSLAFSRDHLQRNDYGLKQTEPLSPREHQVMQALMLGKKTTRIARELSISPSTVEKHRLKVLRKMRVDTVVDLLRMHMPSSARHAKSQRSEL
jgi:two-component system response regulator FixJ